MARGTPIAAGLVARVAGAVRGAARGWADGWFGPLTPLPPVAPPEVQGRQFDYPTGVNLVYTPRAEAGETGIDFATLRALADPVNGGYDLLRLAIETRKDQMESQRWSIRSRDGTDGGPRARELEQRLRKPDLVHTHSQWRRMLLDDLLTIDAPVVYLAPSTLGYRVPQVMDGALLKPVLTQDGRTPLPPEPAYQQNLKGLPACDYTLDELVYMPRNLRSSRLYGMSPVEQVVMTVQIALRRQVSQLEFYTAGSVPDAVANVPPNWTTSQIKEFQNYWDTLISGDTEQRRRMRFMPGGVAPTVLQPGKLKDEFDEWLARVICFCFSLSPQAFVKQMNRATAETAQQAALEEGLEPVKLWWKDFVDEVLAKAFNAPDLEMVYSDEEVVDPEAKANIFSIALGRGGGKPWMTVDEVRAVYGQDPLTPEQQEELSPPPPPALAPGATDQPAGNSASDGAPGSGGGTSAGEPGAKVAKAARRSLRPRPPAGL